MADRYRSPTISVPVDDVDVSLDDFDTEDLITELKHRKKYEDDKHVTPFLQELEDVHAELRAGRIADAIVHLEKLIWPRWRTLDDCEKEFKQARRRSDHQSGASTNTDG